MSVVYVARNARNFGRPLWEILLNLRNFGVGRIVTRSNLERYPEKSFFRIVQVEPLTIEYPEFMKGKILVENTFRGVKKEGYEDIGSVGFKPDYHLIPKHEEEAFLRTVVPRKKPIEIYPRYMNYPPLWQMLIQRDKARVGLEATPEDLRVEVAYKYPEKIKIAAEGEKPTVDIEIFKPVSPELYEGVDLSRWRK